MRVIHLVLALASFAAPTVAEAAPDQPHVAVAVSDLDLASDEGQRLLTARIHRAARAVCKADAVDSLPQHIRKLRRCMRQAEASAATSAQALAAAAEAQEGARGG
jgi:UrcA family protein